MKSTDLNRIAMLLEAVLEKLEALPRNIANAAHMGASLTRQDRDSLSILLPAISAALGDAVFATRDLMNEASNDPELQRAIDRTVPGCTPQKLGKLLARSEGFSENSHRVESAGKAREGVLWRVMHV